MSNDLIASIKNSMPSLKGELDEDTKAVAGGGGGGNYKRISIKGGVFRKLVNGKEVGSIEDRHMNVIFVKMAHNPARTYYSQGYQEGAKVSPTCWSSDSKVPDSDVKNPQSSSCDSCQFSVKGSGQGGMGSACRLSWRTAVVLPNDPSGDVMQLVLPATSCFGKEDNGRYPFRPYIQMLAQNSISAGRLITKMAFDTKSPVPKLLFSPASPVPEEDVQSVLTQSKSSAAETAVKMNVYQGDSAAEAPPPMYTSEPADIEEPKLRTTNKSSDAEPEVSDVVKQWAKNKKK